MKNLFHYSTNDGSTLPTRLLLNISSNHDHTIFKFFKRQTICRQSESEIGSVVVRKVDHHGKKCRSAAKIVWNLNISMLMILHARSYDKKKKIFFPLSTFSKTSLFKHPCYHRRFLIDSDSFSPSDDARNERVAEAPEI